MAIQKKGTIEVTLYTLKRLKTAVEEYVLIFESTEKGPGKNLLYLDKHLNQMLESFKGRENSTIIELSSDKREFLLLNKALTNYFLSFVQAGMKVDDELYKVHMRITELFGSRVDASRMEKFKKLIKNK